MKLKSSLSTTALISALSFLSILGGNIHTVQAFENDPLQDEGYQESSLVEEEIDDETDSSPTMAGTEGSTPNTSTQQGNSAFPFLGANPPQKKSGPLNPASNVISTQSPSTQTRSTSNFVQKAMTHNTGSKGAAAFSRNVEASRAATKTKTPALSLSLKERAIAALKVLRSRGIRGLPITEDQIRVAENLLGSGKALPDNFFQGWNSLTTGRDPISENAVTGPQLIAMANATLTGGLAYPEIATARRYLAANPEMTLLPIDAIHRLITGIAGIAQPTVVQINAMIVLIAPGPGHIGDPAFAVVNLMANALPQLSNANSIQAAREYLHANGNIQPDDIAAINALTTSESFAPTPLQVGLMVEAQDAARARGVMPPLANTPEAHAAATAYIRSLPAGAPPAAVPTEAINFLTGGPDPLRNVTPAQITATATALGNHLDIANATAATLAKEFLSVPGYAGGDIPVQAIDIVLNGRGAVIATPTLDHVLKIQQALDARLDHTNAAAVEGARNFLVAHPNEVIPAGAINALTAAGPGAIAHPTAAQIKAMDTALAGGVLDPAAIQAARIFVAANPGQPVPVDAFNALTAPGAHQVLNPTADQLTAMIGAFATFPAEMRDPNLRDLARDFIGANPASDLPPPIKAISILIDPSVPGAIAIPTPAQMTDMNNVVMTGQFNLAELLAARQYILANPGVRFPLVGNAQALTAARLFMTQDPGQPIPVDAIMALTTGEYRFIPDIDSIRTMSAEITAGRAGTPEAKDAIKILLPARNQVFFNRFGVVSDIDAASIAAVENAVVGLPQGEADEMVAAIRGGVISVLSPQQVANARSFVQNHDAIPQVLPQDAQDAFPVGAGAVAPGQALWEHVTNAANDPTDLHKLNEKIATAQAAGAAGAGVGGYVAAGAGHALRFLGLGGGAIAHAVGAALTPQEAERNARTAHNTEALRIADTLSHAALGIAVPTAYDPANLGSSVAGMNNAIANDLYSADGTRFAQIQNHARHLRSLATEEERICAAGGAVPCNRPQADRLNGAARHFEEIVTHVTTRETARPAAAH